MKLLIKATSAATSLTTETMSNRNPTHNTSAYLQQKADIITVFITKIYVFREMPDHFGEMCVSSTCFPVSLVFSRFFH